MRNQELRTLPAVPWVAAAAIGLLVGTIPMFDDHPSARLLAVLLVAAAVPFGLRRPSAGWVWALLIAWPTLILRLSQTGWHALLVVVYTIVGVYAGDWVAGWWAEVHPRVPYDRGAVAASQTHSSGVAADGTAVAADGLPPQMPGRWSGGWRPTGEPAAPPGPPVQPVEHRGGSDQG